jgi:hypothetical protein
MMTKATREALKDVVRILHEAGWDQPANRRSEVEVAARDVSAYNDLIDQSSTLDPDLKRTLKEAREALETIGLPEADKDDVADDLGKLTAELTKPQPDVYRVRRLWMRIRETAPTVAAILASASRLAELMNRL